MPSPSFHSGKSYSILKTKGLLDGYQEALKIYKARHGDYPTEAQGLSELSRDGIFRTEFADRDVWGRNIKYKREGGSALVYSVGPDGIDHGGNGDDLSSAVKE